MNNRILLIQTGGTIDAEPYADAKNPPEFVKTLKDEDSLIKPTLNGLGLSDKVDMFTWIRDLTDKFVKDSKEFSNQDIKDLANIIKNDDHEAIIITHGTDAMVKNADMLKNALGETDKKVVFVGAMVPLSMNDQYQSDGINSLATAINDIEKMQNGVYVLGENEQIPQLEFFTPDTVVKNYELSIENLSLTFTPKNNALSR